MKDKVEQLVDELLEMAPMAGSLGNPSSGNPANLDAIDLDKAVQVTFQGDDYAIDVITPTIVVLRHIGTDTIRRVARRELEQAIASGRSVILPMRGFGKTL